MNQPDPTALLRDAENYLSALHGSVARHDNLAANLGCAGCELRDQIAAALPTLAVVSPPTNRAGLRDRIAEAALRAVEAALGDTLLPAAREQALAGIAALLPEPTEAHRLALSEALGLGTSAPWDAIRERAAELAGDATAPTLSGRIARLVAKDASALCMDLYNDLAQYARETGNTGLQHAQIRDHLTEFLFERLLRRLAGEQPTQDEALCGKTRGVGGSTYQPCARPAGHPEAYCRSADGNQHFLAAGDSSAPPVQPCPPGCVACATDESHDPQNDDGPSST